MTPARLPADLEAMLAAGHLVEVEPGVFRRPAGLRRCGPTTTTTTTRSTP